MNLLIILNLARCLVKYKYLILKNIKYNQPNDKFLYDCTFYVYLDANNKRVHEEFKIINKYPINKEILKEQKVNLNIEDCEINEEGSLVKKNTKKDDLMEILHNYKGEGLNVLSVIGSIFTGIFFAPALPLCLASMVGGAYLMKQKKENQDKNNKNINNIMLDQKIIEQINEKIYNNK